MALYQKANYLAVATTHTAAQHTLDAFATTYHPNTKAPVSGIYRCTGCGHEAVSTQGNPLPPQNHHTHPNPRVPIVWELAVAATHN